MDPSDNSPDTVVGPNRPQTNGEGQDPSDRFRSLIDQDEFQLAVDALLQMYTADQGLSLTELSRAQRNEVVQLLPPQHTAHILEHLSPLEAAQLADGIDTETVSAILDASSPDVAADVIRNLPRQQSEQVQAAMSRIEPVRPLLQYPARSAGSLMTTECPAVNMNASAASALDIVRLRGDAAERVGAILLVDAHHRLHGSVSIVRLALARPDTIVSQIGDAQVLSVTPLTDQEECARLMERYSLPYVPVAEPEGRLVGVILGEDLVDVVEEEATEDMYKMAGIPGERVLGPLGSSVLHRLPWLYINLGTAFLAALVISIFESTIARVVALAVFLPVVASQGGIGGTQTLTLVVRSMALGELSGRRGVRLLTREVALGLVHGILLGLAVALVAGLWKGNPILGLVLGLAMLVNMLVAGLAGAGVPLLLRRLRLDPAVASAVIVTTFTDLAGFAIFLGLATAMIGALT